MLTVGIDLAKGNDLSAVFRAWQHNGRLYVVPDYLPDEWLDRITLEVDADGKPHYLWTGWNNGEGHAKVKRQGKTIYCHRDIVERVEGRKLTRLQYVDHECARKNCLNYDCLEAVPPGVNTQRGPGRHTQFKPAAAYLDSAPLPDTWVKQLFLAEPLDALE